MPDIPRIVTIPAVLDQLDGIARLARALADRDVESVEAAVQHLALDVAELAQILAAVVAELRERPPR